MAPVTRTMWRPTTAPCSTCRCWDGARRSAFSYRDANADNTTVLEQFLGMCLADDLDEFRQVFHQVKGLPWVNTMAVDDSGGAWYTDQSATPSLSDAATERFLRRLDEDLVAALAFENRIAMLDGSEPDDEWVEHPGARSPGLGAARAATRAVRARRRGQRQRLALDVAPDAHARGLPRAVRPGAHAAQPANPTEPAPRSRTRRSVAVSLPRTCSTRCSTTPA